MEAEEIREAIANVGIPVKRKAEHLEDEAQFVGGVLGQSIESPNPMAVAFRKAAGFCTCKDGCGCKRDA